jgi:RNA polymerase sigma-70 factor (ECF subfamily)
MDAEDALQTAIVRLWRNDNDGENIRLPAAFLAVKRAALDIKRSGRRRGIRENRAMEGGDAATDLFERRWEEDDRKTKIERALRSLPPNLREIVVMKIWGGMTFDAIGGALDGSPNTVAGRYRSALKRMRTALGDD